MLLCFTLIKNVRNRRCVDARVTRGHKVVGHQCFMLSFMVATKNDAPCSNKQFAPCSNVNDSHAGDSRTVSKDKTS